MSTNHTIKGLILSVIVCNYSIFTQVIYYFWRWTQVTITIEIDSIRSSNIISNPVRTGL